MSPARVRLLALRSGSMTSARSGFLDGASGDITYPVMVYVVEHPDAVVVIDTGMHPDLATGKGLLRRVAPLFQPHLAADGSDALASVLAGVGFDPSAVTRPDAPAFRSCRGLGQLPNASV